jgi:hypothetical protein
MNKIVAVGLGIVLLAGVGVVAYRQMNQAGSPPSSSSETASPQNAQESRGSLRNIFGLGQNLTCTFTNEDGSGGTVFVAGERVRGDFTMTGAQGGAMHVVQSDGYTHMWTDGSTQGTKIKIETDASTQTQEETAKTGQSLDLNAQVDYSCSPWGVDASKFVLPAGVTFTDYSEAMMEVKTSGICDQIPDPQAKAACEGAMN